jgi:hypothetical protein
MQELTGQELAHVVVVPSGLLAREKASQSRGPRSSKVRYTLRKVIILDKFH